MATLLHQVPPQLCITSSGVHLVVTQVPNCACAFACHAACALTRHAREGGAVCYAILPSSFALTALAVRAALYAHCATMYNRTKAPLIIKRRFSRYRLRHAARYHAANYGARRDPSDQRIKPQAGAHGPFGRLQMGSVGSWLVIPRYCESRHSEYHP